MKRIAGIVFALSLVLLAENKPLAEVHPFLGGGALTHARIATLPEGILVRSGEVTVTSDDLERALASVPFFAQEGLRRDPFPLLERELARRLLTELAQAEAKAKGETTADGQDLLGPYLARLGEGKEPAEDDLRLFYEQNRDACANLPFEQVKGQIKGIVAEQQQADRVDRFVRELGRTRPIDISAPWIEAHAAQALDNPVDRLRGKGKPVLAVFSAASCCGPDKMVPLLEAIRQEKGEAFEIVYVEARSHQALAFRHRIAGIPTSLVFDAWGAELIRHQGAVDAATVNGWLEAAKAE